MIKSKYRLGWKVVIRTADGMISATHHFHGQRKYAIGVWTQPLALCGPLAVFDTREHALYFALVHCVTPDWPPYICRCQYVRSRESRLYITRKAGDKKVEKFEVPIGTVLAARLRLISARHYRELL